MKVNVLGFGLMARQISALLYLGGFDVSIWNHSEIDNSILEKNIKFLRKSGVYLKEGTVNYVKDLNKLNDNFTIESVVEDINIKKEIYSIVKKNKKQGYVTNSSSLSPIEIGEEVGGIHFFNPIVIKIVEIYTPSDIKVYGLDEIIELLNKFNFEIINVSSNRGYLGNLILFTEISNYFKLYEIYNYDIESIKKMYNKLYNERDLLSIIDLIGVDVSFEILKNLNEVDKSIHVPLIFEKAISEGVLGRKNKTTIKRFFERVTGHL